MLERFYDNFDMVLLRALCQWHGYSDEPLGSDGKLTSGAQQALAWHQPGELEWVDPVVVRAWHRAEGSSELPGELVLEAVVAQTCARAGSVESEVALLLAGAHVVWVDEDTSATLVGPLA